MKLIILIFILLLEFEYLYFTYYNHNSYLPPLFGFLHNVCYVVDHLVMQYFYTFQYCFVQTLNTLNSLIYGYYNVLNILIISFLHFPTNIISIFGLAIALSFCTQITSIIFHDKIKNKIKNKNKKSLIKF